MAFYGWYVVGTVSGTGNAIVVRADDPAVYYAKHEWYGGELTADSTIDFEDFGGSGARLTSSTIKGIEGLEGKYGEDRVVQRLHSEWVSVPFTADGMRRSLFQLAPSIDEFREKADEMGALLDKIA
jgi:hypothetical protein